MPTENLRPRKKAGHAAVERQSPEPLNRLMRRETVHERRETKQALRRCVGAGGGEYCWPESSFPPAR